MDLESDMGVSIENKPENLVWVEEVILNNLEVTTSDPTEPSSDAFEGQSSAEANEGNITASSPQVRYHQQHDLKLMIAEIEMRDENYFGDDRITTLSRLVAARIKYLVEGEDEERNHFWIIKIPSILPQERKLAQLFDVHRREICFYTEILPAMKMWIDTQFIDQLIEFSVPSCFYGRFLRPNDPEPDMELLDHILEAESLLVLDDLRAVEYGKRYFGKGMEVSEVFAAVNEISKFHAVSYAMQIKEREPLHWKELLHWHDLATHYEVLFHKGFILFENFLSNRPSEPDGSSILEAVGHLNSKALHVLKRLLDPTPTSTTGNFPITLIHMDLWSENLLYKVKDEDVDGVPLEDADLDCVIIDWQMASLGKPSHDIALLILLSMDSKTRRDIAHLVLEYYYQLFERTVGWFEVEMPFTYDELVEEFCKSCLLAVMMAICSMDLILMDESAQTRLLDAIRDLIDEDILGAKPAEGD